MTTATATEIWIDAVQHEPLPDPTTVRARRLTSAEVHQRARELRPSWLARELGRRNDVAHEERIADALEANPDLAETLEPRALDDARIGIVVDEDVLGRLRTAIDT